MVCGSADAAWIAHADQPGAHLAPPSVRLVAHVSTDIVLGQGGNRGGGGEAAPQLVAVLNRLLRWIMVFLGMLATVLFAIGGLRYMLANGEIGEIQAAKRAFKGAAVGYAIAALAPAIVLILRSIVGQ